MMLRPVLITFWPILASQNCQWSVIQRQETSFTPYFQKNRVTTTKSKLWSIGVVRLYLKGLTILFLHLLFPYPKLSRYDRDNPVFLKVADWKFQGLLYRLDQPELLPIINSLGPLIKTICEDYEFNQVCFHITGLIGSHRSYIFDPKVSLG